MKISAKGQHALTTMVLLALRQESAAQVPATAIADYIGISKLYLEQILASLRRAGLIESVKGALGGYRLARPADKISIADVLKVAVPDLFAPLNRQGNQDSLLIHILEQKVYCELDQLIRKYTESRSLSDLVAAYCRESEKSGFMFYI
ncbi:MAG: Rrf2 family transcriptional regulator [Ruminococcaceae bacterium]|jgi:Rrf2 family protein|nr:Rrf2 family transcriptional regulator [Oscillospiraceae bacterium]